MNDGDRPGLRSARWFEAAGEAGVAHRAYRFPGLVRPLSRFAASLSRAAGALMDLLGLLLISGVYQSIAGYLAQPFTLR